ncbi:MAG: transcription antitermination factor NusB [Candidatus Aminicenantes bacterium]|nr:MAG: transcription antitermination factor NusB [Candidatus Aminicenantes bacterium]
MFRIKYSREAVMKLLYEVDVLNLNNQLTAKQLLRNNKNFFKGINRPEKDYILKIVQKVLDDKKEIDELITRNLIGWKLERLMPVDRALLRMGVAESYFNDQKAIIIDDVIRIAKKYGGEDSYKIINAVLDKVIQ